MNRRRKILIGLGAAAGTLVLLLGLLFYTPPGLRLVARLVASLSGGQAQITGLSGFFPDHLKAARVAVADEKGVWLVIEDADLHWSALSALFDHIDIQSVSAARIRVLRRPVPSTSQGEGPVIDIAHLSAPRIDLEAPVVGHAVLLSASGRLHYVTLHDLSADLTIARQASSDGYRINGSIVRDVARGHVAIKEGPDGILGKLIGLPGLGPVNVSAEASGDATSNRLSFTASAGALKAQGQGTIQLAAGRADLDFKAAAPQMAPSPSISWQALAAEGHFHGAFTAPRIDAHLALSEAHVGSVAAAHLMLDATGADGSADVKGRATGVMIPGEQPDLFAHAPLQLAVHADLKAADRPVAFALIHPLASLKGRAATAGTLGVTADVAIPALSPFVAARGMDLGGRGQLHLAAKQTDGHFDIGLSGTLDASGTAVAARVLGHAELDMHAQVQGSDILQSRLTFKGRAVSTDLAGTLKKGVLAYRASIALGDLSRLADTLQGSLALHGTVNGPLDTAAVKAEGEAKLAATGFAPRRIGLDLTAQGLPVPASARLSANGSLNDAPLRLLATLADKAQHRLALTAKWKSLDAAAHLSFPDGQPPRGTVHLAMDRLEDIAPFTGSTVSGGIKADVDLVAQGKRGDADFTAILSSLTLDGARVATLTAKGRASDILGTPALAMTAEAEGLSMAGLSGKAALKVEGPFSHLKADLALDMKDALDYPAQLSAAAELDGAGKAVTLIALKGEARGGTLALDGPATVTYGDGLSIEHLAAHVGGGTLTASGRITPKLSLNAALHGVNLESIPGLMPSVGPQGTVSADIALTGTIAAPIGHVALEGHKLRALVAGSRIAPAEVKADIALAGDHAMLDAQVAAGENVDLAVKGRAPLSAAGAMDLTAKGKVDLALLDPLLAPGGQRARGTLAIDTAIAGTLDAPRVTGGAELSGGELQDYARGIRVHDIAASMKAEGTRLTITRFSGQAGPGTISASGTVDLTAPGLPVDMTITAANARPMASDLFSATMNGNLALKGQVKSVLNLSGKLDITRGEINLPENFPPEVAVLNVRRRGQPPLGPRQAAGRIALDVAVSASGPIFVRGHGVDAVMGGAMRVSGTTAQPLISGNFRMVRGEYSVGGQTLTFTSGTVTFNGTGVSHRLDPELDFRATTESGGVSATLAITGYASAPKITLSSSPTLPQDEIVAHLLFQQSVKQLSPLQLASIAQALAAMGGVGGGFNPLGQVRQTLGLDRLAVGSATAAGSTQSQTTVEAGRYVANGVYVGVKQNLSGGTQTQVQVDITDRLKAQATLATGTPAAPSTTLQDNGSSIGLSYTMEY